MCCEDRRGVLLLVVLSMLTLFLLLGAAYIAVARRARMTSQAFANNITATAAAGLAERSIVDNAFLTIVRGTKSNLPDGSLQEDLEEGDDLLGDKYGHNLSVRGQAVGVSTVGSSQAFLKLTTLNLSPAPQTSAELNGRVLTFLMPGLNVSTRILQATEADSKTEIIIAAGPTVSGHSLSSGIISSGIDDSTGRVNIIINGREFADAGTNEPYDGFDDENPLLTRIIPAESVTGSDLNDDGDSDDPLVVTAAAIYGDDALEVDSDADGVSDSRFIDIGLAPFPGSDGKLIYPKAAMLVTDLDGRLNLNVHGSAVDGDLLTGGAEMYPDVGSAKQYHLPRGSGVGPADVSLARSLLMGASPSDPVEQTLVDDGLTVFSGKEQPVQTVHVFNQKKKFDSLSAREVPRVHGVQGRYGETVKVPSAGDPTYLSAAPRPGVRGINDNGNGAQAPDQWRAGLKSNGTTYEADDYFSNPGRFGSPFDYKSRLRIWADPATGQPVFYKPYWDGTVTNTSYDNELIDDPYEVNLGASASRLGVANDLNNTTDNLFSANDLEGVLRYFDSDSLRLNRRLATLLGTQAGSSRLTVTTDSWDTPAVVGTAWSDVVAPYLATISTATSSTRPNARDRIQDLFAPELSMGLKIDINRPFHDHPEDQNQDGILNAGEDLDGNGWLDGEPNDSIGVERRQLFAQQLYCLMVMIAEKNGSTLTDSLREQIAQYAINIVDFRDADSVMTPFNYDKTFGNGSTSWSAAERVWGCERPELIITETFAQHDRKTTYDTQSNSFEQSDRPEGIFYVELNSPWNAQAFEYDRVNATAVAKSIDESPPPSNDFLDTPFHGHLNGQDDAGSLRAEPLPHELIDPGTRGDLLSAAIDLEKVNANNDPVWRLASVKKADAFGAEPLLNTTHTGSNWILDPARSGGPTPERYFYFTQPVSNTADLPCHGIASETAIFWQPFPGGFDPAPETYGVTGTPREAFASPSIAADQDFRGFKGIDGQFGTLTEPLGLVDGSGKSQSSDDPYEELTKTHHSGSGSYTAGQDPITNTTDPNYGSWANPPSVAIDDDNDSDLLINGTHANYAVVYLQRLANPIDDWDATDNPYLTIDCMPVDLNVVNTNAGNLDDPAGGPTQLDYRTEDINGNGVLDNGEDTISNGTIDLLLVQRGGSTAATDFDLWNRSPSDRSSSIDLNDEDTFRTDPTNPRTIATAPALAPSPGFTDTLGSAPSAGSGPYPWMAFLNRPFSSAAELALVPVASPFHLTQRHSVGTNANEVFYHLLPIFETTNQGPWDAVTGQLNTDDVSLIDFVHVPSPYAGIRHSVPLTTVNKTALENQLGLDVLPLEQLSTFREPGRINVNTLTDSRTWRALFGNVKAVGDPDVPTPSQHDAIPGFTSELFGTAANVVKDHDNFFVKLPARGQSARGTGAVGFHDSFGQTHRDTDMNAWFRYQTRRQLENLVTVRSNVYAIWVTVGYFDANGNELSPIKRNRGFYVFDRSIPVAYERGKDHNVRDAILLRRIIQ